MSNSLGDHAVLALAALLPRGWAVGAAEPVDGPIERVLSVSAPDGRVALLTVLVRARLAPREVDASLDRALAAGGPQPVLVVAPFLSPSTRARLETRGAAYLDRTGNVRIALDSPGLYVRTPGADDDPAPDGRGVRSLRGGQASRVVRALVDSKTPLGVRALAARCRVDAGHVSRVLAFLDAEGLIERQGRGRLVRVDWQGLARAAARGAAPVDRLVGRVAGGLASLVVGLAECGLPYAITGRLAVAARIPGAPVAAAEIWTPDPPALGARLGLVPAAEGNTTLLRASDESVLQGGMTRDGLVFAAPSQTLIDLFARGDTLAHDKLLAWMAENEAAWRR